MTKDVVIANALELPPGDRLEVIEQIWDSLDPNDDSELPDELCALLDARLAEHAANPNDTVSWEDAKKSILGH